MAVLSGSEAVGEDAREVLSGDAFALVAHGDAQALAACESVLRVP
jgi:hypothetical protein